MKKKYCKNCIHIYYGMWGQPRCGATKKEAIFNEFTGTQISDKKVYYNCGLNIKGMCPKYKETRTNVLVKYHLKKFWWKMGKIGRK